MEFWNNGILEYWNTGEKQRSKDEKMKSFQRFVFWVSHYSIIPIFHSSSLSLLKEQLF